MLKIGGVLSKNSDSRILSRKLGNSFSHGPCGTMTKGGKGLIDVLPKSSNGCHQRMIAIPEQKSFQNDKDIFAPFFHPNPFFSL